MDQATAAPRNINVHAGGPAEGLEPAQAVAALATVRRVARSKAGALFAQPVTEEQAPGYHAVIRRPMDLGTLAERLEAGRYKSLGALVPLCQTSTSFDTAVLRLLLAVVESCARVAFFENVGQRSCKCLYVEH